MNFVALYTDRLNEELGAEDSTNLFTTARRKQAINQGLRQFADMTEAFTKDSSVTCSNGISEYDLNSSAVMALADFVRFAKQEPEYRMVSSGSSGSTQYVAGQDFRRTTVPWLDEYEPGWRQSTGGTPRYYYERTQGGRRLIGLVPPPHLTSSQTGTLRVPYVARPSSMVSDTDVPFKDSTLATRHDFEPYHEAFAHYGAYRLEKLRLQTEESAAQLQMFMGYVQRFLANLRPKGGTTVRLSRSYFSEARTRRPAAGPRSWPTDAWGAR